MPFANSPKTAYVRIISPEMWPLTPGQNDFWTKVRSCTLQAHEALAAAPELGRMTLFCWKAASGTHRGRYGVFAKAGDEGDANRARVMPLYDTNTLKHRAVLVPFEAGVLADGIPALRQAAVDKIRVAFNPRHGPQGHEFDVLPPRLRESSGRCRFDDWSFAVARHDMTLDALDPVDEASTFVAFKRYYADCIARMIGCELVSTSSLQAAGPAMRALCEYAQTGSNWSSKALAVARAGIEHHQPLGHPPMSWNLILMAVRARRKLERNQPVLLTDLAALGSLTPREIIVHAKHDASLAVLPEDARVWLVDRPDTVQVVDSPHGAGNSMDSVVVQLRPRQVGLCDLDPQTTALGEWVDRHRCAVRAARSVGHEIRVTTRKSRALLGMRELCIYAKTGHKQPSNEFHQMMGDKTRCTVVPNTRWELAMMAIGARDTLEQEQPLTHVQLAALASISQGRLAQLVSVRDAPQPRQRYSDPRRQTFDAGKCRSWLAARGVAIPCRRQS